MTTKNLAIRERVYEKLAEAKHEGESFSDVIERILEKRGGSLISIWGMLRESENMIEIEADIRKMRKQARIRA